MRVAVPDGLRCPPLLATAGLLLPRVFVVVLVFLIRALALSFVLFVGARFAAFFFETVVPLLDLISAVPELIRRS